MDLEDVDVAEQLRIEEELAEILVDEMWPPGSPYSLDGDGHCVLRGWHQEVEEEQRAEDVHVEEKADVPEGNTKRKATKAGISKNK